ncbi:MAG: hypothetical protein H0V52_07485, partial [Acidimicrobiia bacterium]|nr:hypothetical protein [Acidimicrobiia bacterium]
MARVAQGYAAMGDEAFLGHFEFDGTKLKQFPLPSGRPLERARRLDQLAQELAAAEPARWPPAMRRRPGSPG